MANLESVVYSAKDVAIPAAECSIVDFKSDWSDSVKTSICSFLNCHGGKIYFGVANDGSCVGIENADEIIRQVHSVLRFAIHPSADKLVKTQTAVSEGKTIVIATVLEGELPPYYAAIDDGKKKSRVCFIRQSSASVAADDEEISALFEKGNPIAFEDRPSLKQELTFVTLGNLFQAADISFNKDKFRTLGITNEGGFFSNVGFWLSDQCTVETSVTFISGKTKVEPIDATYTFSGCLAKQYAKIRDLLHNRFGCQSKITSFTLNSDGTRKESKDYPEGVIREALINLFANRDYSLNRAQATIHVFSDRMEFVSFGGLPRGVTRTMILNGVSLPRNHRLTEILMRLPATERFSMGIPSIFASYEPLNPKPSLICEPEYIQLTIPRLIPLPSDLTDTENKLLAWMNNRGSTKRSDIQAYMSVSYGTTVTLLNTLITKGIVKKTGSGRHTAYELNV